MDHVEKILEQWRRERPDLDVTPMGLIGRLKRLSAHLSREQDKLFAQFGLSSAGFDVLATLRRSGAPYRLSPGDLMATTMVTSGTMTNRIDQLERQGFVSRIRNPEDGRGFLIALSPQGLALVDEAVAAHTANQARLVAGLSPQEREELVVLATRFLGTFE